MTRSLRPKVVVLGMMSKIPVSGVVWQTMHYLVGLERLGMDVYYVEAHARTPSMLMTHESDDSSALAAAFVGRVMARFGLADRWAFQALHDDGRCYGMDPAQLSRLYGEAALIINLHGGTLPLPEHVATGRLVYLETDPVQPQIELFNALAETVEFLDQHVAHFTFAENFGSPTCTLPTSDRYDFLPTRQPVVLDWWDGWRAPSSDRFTTIANWHQPWRSVRFGERELGWSKDEQYRPLLDLPSRSSAQLELALANCDAPDRLLLEVHGWQVRSAADLSGDVDAYRSYIRGSRGEFSVAKEQNVVFRTGWFSDRSATYLAAGRPVILQDTGFGEVLPTGCGLMAFSTPEEAVDALESVRADYERHAAGARDVARSRFSHDVVLGDLLAALDVRTTAVLACSAPLSSAARGDVSVLGDDLVLTPVSKRPLRLDPATRRALAARRNPPESDAPALVGPFHVDVSIVVPVWNRVDLTQLCLESILGRAQRVDYEVVVVDDGSSDGTVPYLEGLSRAVPRVTVVRNFERRGFAGSVNRGIDVCRGRTIVIANNDTVVGSGWMEGLIAHLDDPEVGMAVASTTAHARNCRVTGDYATYGEFRLLASQRLADHPETRTISMGPLFFAALRRDVIDEVGGLDEQFEIAMFEDDDYSARLTGAGYRIVCATNVLVHHFGEGTLGSLHAEGEFHRLFTANRARFEGKWDRTWDPAEDHEDPSYRSTVTSIRTYLSAAIPTGDAVAVVSGGDDSLVDLDGPWGRHLPSDAAGDWSGHHPEDGAAAVTSAEQARGAGARWLYLPDHSSWWLDHYDGLGAHLASVGRLEHDDDLGRLYRLDPPTPPERIGMDPASVPSACTIISRNYLAQAKVLADSYLAHHPTGTFYLLTVDGLPAGTRIDPRIREVALADLPLDNLGDMCFKYDVVEFATAVKPALLMLLLETYGEERVMYLDPDILVTRPMTEVAEALCDADIVLTPHLNAPIPLDGHMPREQDILISGAYNLGFVAVRAASETARFLEWWRERLQDLCRVDPENGLMVDQRWIDLVPSLFPTTTTLRDDTYNVAYWNLHARSIEHDGERYTCNGRPLAMFHFSGYNPTSPGVISKHQTRSDIEPGKALRELFDAYGAAVLGAGYLESKAWGYGLNAFDNGIGLHAIFRRLYLDLGDRRHRFSDPLVAAGPHSFFAWATTADPGRRGLSPFLEMAYRLRYDIQVAFPDVGGVDRAGFLAWAEGQGAEEFGYEPIVARPCTSGGPVPEGRAIGAAHPVPIDPVDAPSERASGTGVNVCGYLRNESGLGAAARSYIQILEHLDVPLTLRDVSELSVNRSEDTSIDAFHVHHDHPVNLVCINADQHFVVRNQDPAFFADKYNIGVWFWELPSFPDEWRDRFEHYDEIWVGSSYIANTLTPISPIPVVRIMPALGAPQPGDRDRGRRRLGVADEFVFLFMFDFNSYIERKNPVAVIDAFRKAFPGGERARLVVKSVNGESHVAEMSRLEEAAGGDTRIMMLTDYLESTEIADLTHSCDCYVSLHRAEGTGLTMAHAMAAGKPVIATGWSGNTDFMDASNSLLVRFDLVELDRDVGPYKTGGIWADPDVEHATALMRHVFDRPDEAAALGAAARNIIATRFSLENVGRAAAARLEVIADRLPRRMLFQPLTRPEHAGNASLMTTIRAIVADQVRDDRPVIVISKGDPIVADLGGPEAWHFPQDDDGVYAGYYPSDSVTAVAHLERLHERGAGYLLVPATSSWWLRHYAGLRDHLDTYYDRVAEDAACVLYRLDPALASLDRDPPDATVEHLRETLQATGAWVEDLAPRVASTQRELAVLPDVLRQAVAVVSETMVQVESDVDGRLEAIERSQKHLASRVDSTTAALDRFALHVEETRRRDAGDRDAALAELARRMHDLGIAPAPLQDAPAALGPAGLDGRSTEALLGPATSEVGSLAHHQDRPESIPLVGAERVSAPGMSLLARSGDRAAAGIIERRLAARPYMSDDRFSTGRLDAAMGFSRSDQLESERESHPTFADTFRGDPALITERQSMYLPFFAPGELVVDLGCGRGEFLELLTRRGVRAQGVELSGPLARAGRRRGLEISEEDALEYLRATEPATLDGVFSAQFVEHIEPSQLDELLVLTRRALRPGGTCIAETVNPENFEALKTFHVDLTHYKPIFPQVLLHLFWEAGFDCAWVFYPLGGGFTQRSYDSVGEYAVVARA